MYIIDYQKKNGVWHLESSAYANLATRPVRTERTGNFAKLLDIAAQGRNSVSFYLGFRPFPKSSEAILVRRAEGSGAYYHIGTFAGQLVNIEFFVDTIPFLGSPVMPEKLYFRIIEPSQYDLS